MMYVLEVYEPGTTDTVRETFQTSSPFLAIHTGDFINLGLRPNSQAPAKVLRVTNVEQLVWGKEAATWHKLMVFTEEVTRELRLPTTP
jgi:hypothetical protein